MKPKKKNWIDIFDEVSAALSRKCKCNKCELCGFRQEADMKVLEAFCQPPEDTQELLEKAAAFLGPCKVTSQIQAYIKEMKIKQQISADYVLVTMVSQSNLSLLDADCTLAGYQVIPGFLTGYLTYSSLTATEPDTAVGIFRTSGGDLQRGQRRVWVRKDSLPAAQET